LKGKIKELVVQGGDSPLAQTRWTSQGCKNPDLLCCAGATLMTFYKGLPLIGKDTPTIELTGTIVHESTLLFLPGSEFPGHLLHQHRIGASYLIGHCICYAPYINFHLSCFPGLGG